MKNSEKRESEFFDFLRNLCCSCFNYTVFPRVCVGACASSWSVLKLLQSVSEVLTFRSLRGRLRQHRESTLEHTYYI